MVEFQWSFFCIYLLKKVQKSTWYQLVYISLSTTNIVPYLNYI